MSTLNQNKRRYHQRLYNAVLKDWYGEERGRVEMVNYCPESQAVGELVEGLMSKAVSADCLKLFAIKDRWLEFVGVQLSKYSEPVSHKDGWLEVVVSHPAWIREMQGPVKKTIIANINRAMGENFCRDIRFVPGGR